MSTLIIPAAGQSTRFPGVRPKWQLTAPTNQVMLVAGLSKLSLDAVNHIYVTVLEEHVGLAGFDVLGQIREDIAEMAPHCELHFLLLAAPTVSQPETIARTIQHFNITGPLFIKDCDSLFQADLVPGNAIWYGRLSAAGKCVAHNKSYIQCETLTSNVLNIVEKIVISERFCVGLYQLSEAQDFLEAFDWELNNGTKDPRDYYVSDVLYSLMLKKVQFLAKEATEYVDWNRLEDWLEWTGTYQNLLVDLDGTLVSKTSEPIKENVEVLQRMAATGKVFIVITTARRESEEEVGAFLRSVDIPFHRVVTNMLHAKRTLINDTHKTNPYPSAIAINLPRYSPTLGTMLR